jgi:hypothetical protein
MKKINEKSMIEFTYQTDEWVKREIKKQISKLTEDQKSEYVFNEEPLYVLGRGHDFCYGYFIEYITKTGIIAKCFYSKIMWCIAGEIYDYKNNEFIKRAKIEPSDTNEFNDFYNLGLSIVRRTDNKSLASDLLSIKPKG